MGKLTCPKCQHTMTMNFDTNEVYCPHCGYIRPDEISGLERKESQVKAQRANRHVEITQRGDVMPSAMAAFETGQDCLDRGDKQAALQSFKRAADYQPDFADAHLWIAKCSDDEKTIRDELGTVLGLVPNQLEALRMLMVLNGRLTPQEAARTYGDGEAQVQKVDGPVAAQATELLCPNCGGQLTVNVERGRVECRFCGYSAPQTNHAVGSDNLSMALLERKAKPVKWNIGSRLVQCQQCGAEHTIPAEKMSQRCRFCGSTQVIVSDALKSFEQPDGVIPFRLTAEQAMEAVNQQLNSLGERIFGFFNTNKVQHHFVEGVYLPYWVYDVNVEILSTRTFDYDTDTSSEGMDQQDGVGICAVKSPPRDLTSRISDFDMADVAPYEPKWLARFPAQLYTIDFDKASLDARELVSKVMQRKHNRVVEHKSRDEYGRERVTEVIRMMTQIQSMTFQLVLMPVWMVHMLEVDDEIRTGVVNAQTGKVALGKSQKVDVNLR